MKYVVYELLVTAIIIGYTGLKLKEEQESCFLPHSGFHIFLKSCNKSAGNLCFDLC